MGELLKPNSIAPWCILDFGPIPAVWTFGRSNRAKLFTSLFRIAHKSLKRVMNRVPRGWGRGYYENLSQTPVPAAVEIISPLKIEHLAEGKLGGS
jgi:hypothetical protein